MSERMPWGKHKGEPVESLDTGYLDWLIGQDWLREPRHARLRDAVDEELCERMARGEYSP